MQVRFRRKTSETPIDVAGTAGKRRKTAGYRRVTGRAEQSFHGVRGPFRVPCRCLADARAEVSAPIRQGRSGARNGGTGSAATARQGHPQDAARCGEAVPNAMETV
jgi:hypothetical protein